MSAREEQIDLPDDAKVCDCCGKTLADLGQSDISEQIEIETIVYRRVIRRKRYRRTCDCADRQRTVTAPLPPKLLPKSIYGTSLWVHLLLEKFHLQRPTSTMLRTVPDDRAASTVGSEPCAGNNRRWTEANRAAANAALRSDSCPPLAVGVLSRGRDAMESFRGKSWKNGASLLFWLFAGEDTVVYVLGPSRSHHVPQSHFPDDMQGVLTVDRTSAYKAMQQVKSGNLLLAFC